MRFIQLSDFHFHRQPNDNTAVTTTLSHVRERYPEHYLIVTGDIVDDGHEEQYKRAYEALAPFTDRIFICPGNHDFGAIGSFYSRERAERFDRFLSEPLKQGGTFSGDPTPVVNTVGDAQNRVMLIALDTNLETDHPFDFACGEVGAEQLAALETLLSAPSSAPFVKILFCHHHPFIHQNPFMELKDARELMRLLYGRVQLLLFGHKHVSQMWTQKGGIDYILAADNAPGKDYAREIVIDGGKIAVNDIPIAAAGRSRRSSHRPTVEQLERRLEVLESGQARLSPNILDGVYDCGQDPGNWVLWSQEVLALLEARCHDNGEGADWPHGPFGHIYIDLFDPPPDLDTIPDGADHRRLMEPPLRLRGCCRTHDGLDEWLDGDIVTYRQGGIWAWGEREEIVLRLYESDGSEDGAWGRRNDVLGFERIRKTDTTGQVVTVSCHPFTNDHPRRRRPDQVAFELKLQTMTWTFPTQQVDQVKIDSRKGNTVWAEHLEPGGRYGIKVKGHFRYAESGKRQDAVYRQRRSGHWQTGDAEPTWGFRIQGRLPWNEDRPPAYRSDHTYRFVGMADGRGRMGFRIEDNEYADNDGVLEVGIYGPIAV